MTGQECYPYPESQGTRRQSYYTPLSTPSIFDGSLSYCQNLDIYYQANTGQLILRIIVKPSYKLIISIQTVTTTPASSANITLSSSSLVETASILITSSGWYNCSNRNLTLTNYKNIFTPNITQPQS